MNTGTQQAYSIPEAAKAAGISRTLIYRLIGDGSLQARKIGRRTVILAADLALFLNALPGLR